MSCPIVINRLEGRRIYPAGIFPGIVQLAGRYCDA